jgi:hypothetical protein
MFDPCEINHGQIPHICAYVALEPDLAYMCLEYLGPHLEERTPGSGSSLEAEEERNQEDHSRFADCREGERVQQGCSEEGCQGR